MKRIFITVNTLLIILHCQTSFAVTENAPVIAWTTLVSSKTDLALSVQNTDLNAALTGNPRTIKISNTGFYKTVGLTIAYPAVPNGAGFSTTCGSELTPGTSCSITVIPGDAPTSDCNSGAVPTPGKLMVSARNAAPIYTNVFILTYGCLYQGGYLFSVDDTTPETSSISGKVAEINDDSSGFEIWSNNKIYVDGITESSTSPCNGSMDGACNTKQIIDNDPAAVSANSCANYTTDNAGHSPCPSGTNCYKNWYLPSICELGYGSSQCGGSPGVEQNIQYSLLHNSNVTSFSIYREYQSSTEFSPNPINVYWGEFLNPQDFAQHGVNKFYPTLVRCVRKLSDKKS